MAGFDVRYPNQDLGRNSSDPGELPLSSSDPTGALGPKVDKEEDDARLLRTMNAWWQEARDAHAANRTEQHKDCDYYDHMQIQSEIAAALAARGQAPLVYNLIKMAIDWIIGTERRTRIDWKIHPRGPEDQPAAQAKATALKYVDDANDGSFARSAAFAHTVKAGIGWLEDCYEADAQDEPITHRHVDWKDMWWDPFAKKLDLSDARYMTRSKWVDVDFAIAMFPDKRDLIERHARAVDEIDLEDAYDPADVPGLFLGQTLHNTFGSLSSIGLGRRLRSRVRLLETWYTMPVPIKRMTSLDPKLNRKAFNKNDPTHVRALELGMAVTSPGVEKKICMALWVPGALLDRKVDPYKHKRYPFTPIIAFRNDKTGLPYGPIRGMRDAQDDYNKRHSKALFLMSVNRVIYEAGAIDEEDEDDFLDECAAPDARLRVAKGAIEHGRIKFETGLDMAKAQFEMMGIAKEHILEGNGVTRENLGQESNAISGRAILAKQQQGAVTTAEIFDNYRFAFRTSGRKGLSNLEQFMTLPKRLRIVGSKGLTDWLTVNEPMFDPTSGEIFFNNDLAAAEADFHVDQQDYRETQRMAMAESLFETMKGLDPTVQIQLIDLAIELTDLPNREEFVRRLRAINGQGAPGEEESPEAMERKQREAALAERERSANLELTEAKASQARAAATKTRADTVKTVVDGKTAALQGASLLAGAVPLAPTADRLAAIPDHITHEARAVPAAFNRAVPAPEPTLQ